MRQANVNHKSHKSSTLDTLKPWPCPQSLAFSCSHSLSQEEQPTVWVSAIHESRRILSNFPSTCWKQLQPRYFDVVHTRCSENFIFVKGLLEKYLNLCIQLHVQNDWPAAGWKDLTTTSSHKKSLSKYQKIRIDQNAMSMYVHVYNYVLVLKNRRKMAAKNLWLCPSLSAFSFASSRGA